jgi:hypothetical protein
MTQILNGERVKVVGDSSTISDRQSFAWIEAAHLE